MPVHHDYQHNATRESNNECIKDLTVNKLKACLRKWIAPLKLYGKGGPKNLANAYRISIHKQRAHAPNNISIYIMLLFILKLELHDLTLTKSIILKWNISETNYSIIKSY